MGVGIGIEFGCLVVMGGLCCWEKDFGTWLDGKPSTITIG